MHIMLHRVSPGIFQVISCNGMIVSLRHANLAACYRIEKRGNPENGWGGCWECCENLGLQPRFASLDMIDLAGDQHDNHKPCASLWRFHGPLGVQTSDLRHTLRSRHALLSTVPLLHFERSKVLHRLELKK